MERMVNRKNHGQYLGRRFVINHSPQTSGEYRTCAKIWAYDKYGHREKRKVGWYYMAYCIATGSHLFGDENFLHYKVRLCMLTRNGAMSFKV